ncbi:MAG: ATP synthase F1 subunit gamma [Anaerolineae bacterium]|jgi:F-type H+-transporting ATPase subunit gamma
MASSRDIQRRIKSVANIGKVTRAMEAVSASKMRRAQAATLASRAYAEKAAQVMAYLSAQRGGGTLLHPLLQEHPDGKPLVVLITPNRGLTGGLVLNIIRYAVREAEERFGADVAWVTIGRKGSHYLSRIGADLDATFDDMPDGPSILDVTPVRQAILEGYLGPEYSSVHVVYADFGSVVRQEPVVRALVPIEVPEAEAKLPAEYSFEPSPEAILDEVLPRLLELRLYQTVLEAQASEHAARMIAMRNATDAANELVDELTLTYNKARQADITSEILDIAGGAEALRKALAAK